jgi:16S rRNA (adenine(1408)-N(1))-methyltransferase
VRRIRGRKIVELAAVEFKDLADRYAKVVLDVGTGDGKHALALARQRPDQLIVGLDAAKDNLRKVSGRTDVANLLFVWAAVEQLPAELTGVGEVHVLMPWGSLLRGMLGDGSEVLGALAGRCVPNAGFLVTLNLHAWRPPVPEVGTHPEPTPDTAMSELAELYGRHGWRLEEAHYLDDELIARLATSWTRRLNSSRDRLDVLALTGLVNPAAGR